ncbi:hypothetical protein IWW56_001024 [Coemansia sp. RSA 2131]|nr:hypothetical protein IWW56_001024 [Coemansia sp. RSA 2131]
MLGVGHGTNTTGDRSVFRQSWSSDEPTSSNASVSSKERKGLWNKLRKQASRMHASQSTQTDIGIQRISSAASAPNSPGVFMRPHPMSADARRASACVGPTTVSAAATYEQVQQAGIERLKLIAAGDNATARTNSLLMQPRRAAPPPPMATTMSESAVRGSLDMRGSTDMRGSADMRRRPGPRMAAIQESNFNETTMRGSVDMYRRPGPATNDMRGSVDMYRRGYSHSVDIPRAVDHTNPNDISAESIRRTLGAYTGKTETKGKPRLRRLMLRPTTAREPTDAGLACIAEDDEPPMPMHVHGVDSMRVHMHSVDVAKRFSENSGSTACSSDTQDSEVLRAGARRQRLSAFGAQSRPKAVFYEDGVIGIPDSRSVRPPSSVHRTGSLLSRQGSVSARHRLSRCASDETLDATADVERLKRSVRLLEARNDMLNELLARDPMDGVPEGVRMHVRTLELENAWMRQQLAQLR